MSSKQLVDALKTVLANQYALYLKTQNYHWNVEGPNFSALHLMFESQYKSLGEAIDTVAELIRGLGEKAPGSWGAYQEITSLKPGNERATASEMLKDLLQDQGALEGILQEALKVAQNAGDEVISDFIVGRLAAHRKVAWMLKSSL